MSAGGDSLTAPEGFGDPAMPAGEPEPRRTLVVGVRARVLISFLVLLVVSTAASLLVLRSVLLSRIGDEVQSTLTEQADTLRQVAGAAEKQGEKGRDLQTIFNTFLSGERPLEDGVLLTYIDGKIYRAEPEEAAPAGLADQLTSLSDTTTPRSGEVQTRAGPARYIAIPISSGNSPGVLIAAKQLAPERDQVESAIRIALGVGIVVMLLASLFIWLAASRAMAPLHTLAEATQKITETDLADRVPVRGTDELADLGRTFNGMLDRLETAFADQKEFLADVGHELRTPITVIRGHLETLGDDPAEREEATNVIQDELGRMSRLVDDLLMLARSGRPDFLRPEPLDLDLLTHDLFGKAKTLGERHWRLDQIGIGIIHADSHRLASAVMNLAQNAVKHTTPGEEISIGSSLDSGEARIWVRDDGPGINPVEAERIFERFAHAEDAPGGGAGLGLAIVSAIAEAHGGRVELESRPGLGARFTLVLPTHDADFDWNDEAWPGS
jgi:two-component system OmpR family sensor kinase